MARRTIAGSRVAITGASSGIGQALARELAAQRALLILNGRREEKLRQLADELGQQGAKVAVVVGDVTEPLVRQTIVDRADQQFGGLDVLVNNAGIGALGRFADAAPERLREIMEVNFFALSEMTRLALPVLARGRAPLIVNIGSILGHRGIPLSSEYCASKFAVRGFSESLRAELAGQGIDVLVVSPGTTETEFFANVIERRGKVAWADRRGVPAAVVARKTVRAMQRGAHEIIPNTQGWLLVWLNRLSPRLVDSVMKRFA
jgi:short-subunit dehydrogenase